MVLGLKKSTSKCLGCEQSVWLLSLKKGRRDCGQGRVDFTLPARLLSRHSFFGRPSDRPVPESNRRRLPVRWHFCTVHISASKPSLHVREVVLVPPYYEEAGVLESFRVACRGPLSI